MTKLEVCIYIYMLNSILPLVSHLGYIISSLQERCSLHASNFPMLDCSENFNNMLKGFVQYCM